MSHSSSPTKDNREKNKQNKQSKEKRRQSRSRSRSRSPRRKYHERSNKSRHQHSDYNDTDRRRRDERKYRSRDKDVQQITKKDNNLKEVNDDPRVDKDGNKIIVMKGGGRNTESFDPKSTLVRPDMRIIVGPNRPVLEKKIKHDDVIVVPEFFCSEDNWDLYYQLIEEMRGLQDEGEKGAEWISWHEGAHLISKNPSGSKTFQMILDKIGNYFGIEQISVGTRFNWYRDSTDWKPFHHDSAAFNPERAKNQNITVGVSFGATRELAFLHAKNGTKIYFPQTNGMLFSFGRDVNIIWKHGVNALPQEEQDGKGRISIILWGNCNNVIEEDDSPPLLNDNTRGNGHSIHSNSQNSSNIPCKDYLRGDCRYGNRCKFSHSRR